MSGLLASRVLLVLGFSIGLVSWYFTISHIGDPTYLLTEEFVYGQTHAWYHAFREAAGDIAAMLVIGLIFFGHTELRSRASWLFCLILMSGYYAPFWIGMPFMKELSAPNLTAETVHIVMAVFAVAALFIARKDFVGSDDKAQLI